MSNTKHTPGQKPVFRIKKNTRSQFVNSYTLMLGKKEIAHIGEDIDMSKQFKHFVASVHKLKIKGK
jgi:hypothetical protein